MAALAAAMSALNAFSIDIMLPAFPDIAREFALANSNDCQLLVVAYLATFGAAQLVYGPVSDAIGRRGVLMGALVIYLIGTLLCIIAPTFETLLAARAMQGLGAAATRVISSAVIRDQTSGPRMAQIMSLSMTIFMIVPIVAPGVGQLILFVAPWHWIFAALLFYAAAIVVWMLLRLPETLPPERRTAFRFGALMGNYGAALSNRQTLGYIVAGMCLSSGMFAYIATSQQIYVDVFDLGALFPLAFAAVAIAMSIGSAINARIVMHVGLRRLSQAMVVWFIVMSAINAAFALAGLGSFWVFVVLLGLTFAASGVTMGNFAALCMEPAGRFAGAASALQGAVTAIGGAIVGGFIARHFDGTTTPFLIGLVTVGLASLAMTIWAERGRMFPPDPARH
jgi:DHA1 family bicyclomycin/chloramphenicol resistance-like MFS transporter